MKSLLVIICLIIAMLSPMGLMAEEGVQPFVPSDDNAGEFNVALGNAPPYTVAARIINVALGLMGIFTLLLLIYGGYIWMNARGNEEEVKKAKKIIEGAIIGLVIILSSLGISQYVFNNLVNVTAGS